MQEYDVLIDEETIISRIKELAKQIETDYLGEKITLLCILKGSTPFMVDLSKYIHNEVKYEFMRVSSYGNERKSTGNIQVKVDLTEDIQGENVIIVEDIIDSGRTLKFLKEYLYKKNPKSLKICTLLNKPDRRVVNVDVDYTGFVIEDKFVFGYGLDYDEYYRNLPYIAYIKD